MGNCINIEDGIAKKISKMYPQEIALNTIDFYLSFTKPLTYRLPLEKVYIISKAQETLDVHIKALYKDKEPKDMYLATIALTYRPIQEHQKQIWRKLISTEPIEVLPQSPINRFKIVIFSLRKRTPCYLTDNEIDHTMILSQIAEINLCEKLFGKFGELDRLIFDNARFNKNLLRGILPLITKRTAVSICM
jgi:hypothetical protein